MSLDVPQRQRRGMERSSTRRVGRFIVGHSGRGGRGWAIGAPRPAELAGQSRYKIPLPRAKFRLFPHIFGLSGHFLSMFSASFSAKTPIFG